VHQNPIDARFSGVLEEQILNQRAFLLGSKTHMTAENIAQKAPFFVK
jgi:hypothetical protein